MSTLFKLFLTACIYLVSVAFAQAEGLLQGINGQDISLSELRGKWVFINYWASWCHSCIDEIPELNRFYEDNRNNNIALFAVNYEMLPLDIQQQLIKKLDIRYPSLKRDPANDLQLGDIRGLPVTFVFNPEGKLINTLYGGQTYNALKKEIVVAAQ